MRFKSFFISTLFFVALTNVQAQSNLLNAKTPDQIGEKSEAQLNADNDKPLPYGYVHDRDILFGKRVWEIIDLDERMNFPLLFPLEETIGDGRKSLYNVLLDAIKSGELSEIYDDSYFTIKKTLKELESVFMQKEINSFGRQVKNSYPDNTIEELVANGTLTDEHFATAVVTSSDVLQYKVVGLWYFDKRQAEMKYRILGICPMAVDALSKLRDIENAEPIELFWVYFRSARDILHEAKSFNDRNSAMPISFDHLLNSRRFSSVIIKEENVYGDRAVNEYMKDNALNQLLESQRIKEKIRDIEQDMWNY
uniref:type IX secretion system ring protein PorN/GldN n=1 Tax=Flavobacterium sp. TaxID=239 RepID=UPI00404B57A4